METCSFCEIIHGRQQAFIIMEDKFTIVIKDRKPVNQFHILAIPKIHVPTEEDLQSSRLHREMVKGLVRSGKKMLSALGADMNDVLYGFHKHPYLTIRHLHLHLISPSRNFHCDEHLYQFNTKYFISARDVLKRIAEPERPMHNNDGDHHVVQMDHDSDEGDMNCCVIL